MKNDVVVIEVLLPFTDHQTRRSSLIAVPSRSLQTVRRNGEGERERTVNNKFPDNCSCNKSDRRRGGARNSTSRSTRLQLQYISLEMPLSERLPRPPCCCRLVSPWDDHHRSPWPIPVHNYFSDFFGVLITQRQLQMMRRMRRSAFMLVESSGTLNLLCLISLNAGHWTHRKLRHSLRMSPHP